MVYPVADAYAVVLSGCFIGMFKRGRFSNVGVEGAGILIRPCSCRLRSSSLTLEDHMRVIANVYSVAAAPAIGAPAK